MPPHELLKKTPASEVVQEDLMAICQRMGNCLKALEGRSMLVAGGAGFLPSYMLDAVCYANDHILEKPCQIICWDDYTTGTPQRIAHLQGRTDFHLARADIAQPLNCQGSLDYIVHAASIASPKVYRQFPLKTIDTNVTGARNLLELARQKGVRNFLYLSSSEIYGDPTPESIPTPETYRGNVSCTGPRACYDESKRLAETLCNIYHRDLGVPMVIVRPFNVYGPRLRLDDGRVIPDLLRDALTSRPLTLYSDGKATRSFCYITDAVSAMLLLLLHCPDGEAFNVGNSEEVSVESLAMEINSLAGNNAGIDFQKSADKNYLSDNPQRRCPDLRKTMQAIPWKPQVSLREGLARTLRSYRENA